MHNLFYDGLEWNVSMAIAYETCYHIVLQYLLFLILIDLPKMKMFQTLLAVVLGLIGVALIADYSTSLHDPFLQLSNQM